MRKLLLSLTAFFAGLTTINAQTIADFESLSLSKADTFYLNYSAPLSDVGFDNGLAHFPCVYDTAFGGYWVDGFAYSNMTDSISSGYTNQYSAKTAIGFAGSSKYAVAYGYYNKIQLKGAAIGKSVDGFYITNSTYAYNSMRDGDGIAKKFGGTTGSDTDWFKLTIKGYLGGVLKPAAVNFYLADFRSATSAGDYIVNDWQYVNLSSLGHVDSLEFTLTSTDNGSFGMNTPAYFCIDNFITNETSVSIHTPTLAVAKVYPNPATDKLYVEVKDQDISSAILSDYTGKIIATYEIASDKFEMNTSALMPGAYILTLKSTTQNASVRFIKQ